MPLWGSGQMCSSSRHNNGHFASHMLKSSAKIYVTQTPCHCTSYSYIVTSSYPSYPSSYPLLWRSLTLPSSPPSPPFSYTLSFTTFNFFTPHSGLTGASSSNNYSLLPCLRSGPQFFGFGKKRGTRCPSLSTLRTTAPRALLKLMPATMGLDKMASW